MAAGRQQATEFQGVYSLASLTARFSEAQGVSHRRPGELLSAFSIHLRTASQVGLSSPHFVAVHLFHLRVLLV